MIRRPYSQRSMTASSPGTGISGTVSLLRNLEAPVVDAGVRERRLQPIFRDRFREGIGPLQRVAAGVMASSRVLPLDDDDVRPRSPIVAAA